MVVDDAVLLERDQDPHQTNCNLLAIVGASKVTVARHKNLGIRNLRRRSDPYDARGPSPAVC